MQFLSVRSAVASLATLIAALTAAPAAAADLTLTIGDEAALPDCGGNVRITKSDQDASREQLNVVFAGVKNCSTFDILAANGAATTYGRKKLGGNERSRGGSFTLPRKLIEVGYNNIKVVVRSNSGKTADVIRLRVVVAPPPPPSPPSPLEQHRVTTLTINQATHLEACGGVATVTRSAQGDRGGEQVNLVFRGVARCSNFDIVANDGASIDYPNKKLDGSDGDRGGSFTLPKRLLDRGWNNVKIILRSNSRDTSETLRVQFVVAPARP